jgi:hypothetical protein
MSDSGSRGHYIGFSIDNITVSSASAASAVPEATTLNFHLGGLTVLVLAVKFKRTDSAGRTG